MNWDERKEEARKERKGNKRKGIHERRERRVTKNKKGKGERHE